MAAGMRSPFYGGHTVQTIRSQGERGIGASEEH